jgi:predicted nucleic acid-binding protein
MSYVVDASVVVKWFVETERFFEEALAFLERHRHELQAPDLLLIEVANAIRKKQSQGEISAVQANEIFAAVREYIVEFQPAVEFVDRALEIALALDHSIYDCIYLACAEASGAVMVTDDDRFVRKVVATPLKPLVQSLVDVQ